MNWIIENQLGRRNLHPDQASYLRGKRYNGEKQDKGGDRKSIDQNDPLIESTADRLATEYKVSAPTIKRDGQYAAAVDKLAEAGRISTDLFEKSENKDQSGSDSDWFSDWRNKAGLPKNTGYDWWSAFCKHAGLKLTPKMEFLAEKSNKNSPFQLIGNSILHKSRLQYSNEKHRRPHHQRG